MKSSNVYMKKTIFLNLSYNPKHFHIITTTYETAFFFFFCSNMVANVSTQEAEAGRSLSCSPAWSTQ